MYDMKHAPIIELRNGIRLIRCDDYIMNYHPGGIWGKRWELLKDPDGTMMEMFEEEFDELEEEYLYWHNRELIEDEWVEDGLSVSTLKDGAL